MLAEAEPSSSEAKPCVPRARQPKSASSMAPKPKSDAENKEERRCEAAALEIVNKGGNVGKDLRRKDKVLITIPRRRRVFQDGIGRWNDILSEISASRCVETPSRHRRDSCPSDEVVGGFFFEFEAIRTASRDRNAPRRYRGCRRSGSSRLTVLPHCSVTRRSTRRSGTLTMVS